MSPDSLIAALAYLDAGLSVVPVDVKSKRSIGKWSHLKAAAMTRDQARAAFANGQGVALVTGKVSGGLESLDFDFQAELKDTWKARVEARAPGLLKRLVVERTQNGGLQIFYRCPDVSEGSQKLAHKAVQVPGPGEHEYTGKKLAAQRFGKDWWITPCLIETRGEGGYFLVPPSVGYSFLQGDATTIPVLTAEERQILIDCAIELDDLARVARPARKEKAQRSDGQVLPGDRYNQEADLSAYLQQQGWVLCGQAFEQDGETLQYLTRPGKAAGISATLFDDARLYVFSTNAAPLEGGRSYDAFGVYAAYEHGGNLGSAAGALGGPDLAEIVATLEWDKDVLELPPPTPLAPRLPPDMCPEPLGTWWRDIAERMDVSLEYPACMSIIVLGSLIGRQLGVRPKMKDNWTVIPNLWGAIVGRPSTLKSATISQIMEPLELIEKEVAEAFELAQVANQIEIDTAKAEEKEALKMLAKAIKVKDEGQRELDMEGAKAILAQARERLQDLENAKPRRYATSDVTVEKLTEMLRDNPNGLLVHRDELVGQLAAWSKKGREGEREFFLEAWNGNGFYRCDRVGRGSVTATTCVSVMGGMQPGKLRGLLDEVLMGEGAADGLLQRFQLLAWPENRDARNVDQPPNEQAQADAVAIHRRLANLDLQALGAEQDERGVPYLRFHPAAYKIWSEWMDTLLARLNSGKLPEQFESHLGKYRSLMPALALVFHLVSGAVGPVSPEAAALAADWCGFLEQHAQKVYARELGEDRRLAHLLADKIREGKVRHGCTVREIYRNQWSGLRGKDEVLRALSELSEFGWVQIITGHRGTEIVALHESLREPGNNLTESL